jgi:hypothetical protein
MKLPFALPLLACLSLACVEINGGAVEFSWVIRSRTGSAITDCGCAAPEIATVRLVLVLKGGPQEERPCDTGAQCDFACARQTGSTAFNIPETHGTERYEVSVVAVGVDGRPLEEEVMVPAPILREVVRGQPTEVESMQLIADCATECGMNTSGVCARP